jgi:hypothetical protein
MKFNIQKERCFMYVSYNIDTDEPQNTPTKFVLRTSSQLIIFTHIHNVVQKSQIIFIFVNQILSIIYYDIKNVPHMHLHPCHKQIEACSHLPTAHHASPLEIKHIHHKIAERLAPTSHPYERSPRLQSPFLTPCLLLTPHYD